MSVSALNLVLQICVAAIFCCEVIMSNPPASTSCFIKARNHLVENYSEETEGSWKGSYAFVFAADPQPGLINQVEQEGNGSNWDREIELMNEAVNAINELDPLPKFVFLGGDILNAFPGQQYRDEQYASVQASFSRTNKNIPIFVASGNHDVGNVPTNETRDIYNQEFGDEYYTFWVGGVFYIVIDSQYLFDDSLTPERSAAQETWFTSVLQKAKNSSCKHVVLFMHIPLFLDNVDEEDNYFSIKKADRVLLLNKFADAGIKTVFHGHYHRQAGGEWSRTNEDGTEHTIQVVVSSAIGCQLGNQQSGINIVKVTENNISHTYYPMSEIPQTISFD
uniref:Serine/threonine-protein phosphatase CPPED1-like n=1 Tax=Phallusia mammillata TaxID=59560 RepID=A0A6F9DAJ3_9ASCI|nr:serine/threonine-protein phosphatase CPPED1-like [Phallusia mammillata]